MNKAKSRLRDRNVRRPAGDSSYAAKIFRADARRYVSLSSDLAAHFYPIKQSINACGSRDPRTLQRRELVDPISFSFRFRLPIFQVTISRTDIEHGKLSPRSPLRAFCRPDNTRSAVSRLRDRFRSHEERRKMDCSVLSICYSLPSC